MDINNTNLESALNSSGSASNESEPKMSTEMEIGFHQGSLNTLAGERHALTEMVNHVNARIQSHAKRLEELGVSAQKKE